MRLICILFSSIIILSFSGCGQESENINLQPRPVKLLTVTDQPYTLSYYFPGKVLADKKTILSFQVPGRIIEIPIKVGMNVKKDDILAELDDRNYKNNYLKSKAKYQEAQIEYDRAEGLVKKDVISKAEYDNKKMNVDVAKSEMEIAKKEFNDTVLYAPFTGVIAKREVEKYQEVKAKEPIFIIQNLDYLEIEVFIPGKHIINLQNIDSYKCDARFSSVADEKFKLEIKEKDTIADPQTLAYRVIFRMPSPPQMNILPGMTARVEITKTIKNDENKDNQYKIPVEAVVSNPDKSSFVWLVDPDTMTVHKNDVKINQIKNNSVIINEGLKAGDVLAVSGVNYLSEGQKVYQYNDEKGI